MILLIALTGCAADGDLFDTMNPVDPSTGPIDSYQLVAWPGLSTNPDGSVRAYPIRIADIPLDSSLDLEFKAPVHVEGSIVGLNATPRPRARLPGTLGPVPATIAFRRDESLEDQVVHTDDEGLYSAWLVPGAQEVVVRPDSPLVPPLEFAFDVPQGGTTLNLDLREFLPIWGKVTQDLAPKRNAQVRLVFSDGSVGPTTSTDDDGWYELRVSEGLTVGVDCLGAGDGIDPILSLAPTAVGQQGLRHDCAYQDLPLHTLSTRLLTVQGTPISGVPFRFVSRSLTDYPAGEVVRSGFTDTSGNLTVRALAGQYELSLLMERDSNRTSQRLAVDLMGPLNLAAIEMAPLRRITGWVGDTNQSALPDALVSCAEIGFSRRTWSTTTDAAGEFALDVTQSPVSCSAVADARQDLAGTRIRIEEGSDQQDFILGGGRLVEGTLSFEGATEEFGLVEVVGQDGLIWASALSDNRGAYQLRIQPDSDL